MVPIKGLIIRNAHQSSSTHCSKVISKVKVFKEWVKLQGQRHRVKINGIHGKVSSQEIFNMEYIKLKTLRLSHNTELLFLPTCVFTSIHVVNCTAKSQVNDNKWSRTCALIPSCFSCDFFVFRCQENKRQELPCKTFNKHNFFSVHVIA